MKKELPVKAVIGILAAVIVIVGLLAWRTFLPPPPPPAHFTKEMSEAHAKSVQEIQEDQKRRAAEHRGGQ